jgi:hypothetical protein
MGVERDHLPEQTAELPARSGPNTRIVPDRLREAVAGRYRLDRELGRGGFGIVCKAYDLVDERDCCVKFLAPHLAHGFPLVRFKREFRTARRVRHPCSIKVFELGQSAGIWFFSMELVEGTHLGKASWIKTPQDIAAVALQILAALDEVHSRAIVHRDIKPHNILVRPGEAKAAGPVARLVDFGIARVGDLDDDERIRALRGSPRYMAPELVTDGIADPRADLYGLGVTVYEHLAGQHPLGTARSAGEWLAQIRRDSPQSLCEVAPEVPRELADIVMRLCAPNLHARYRSAAEAYNDLAMWLQRTGQAVPELPELTRGPYLAAPRMVGREDAQRRINRFLADNLAAVGGAAGDTAPLLFLSGPAGVGKSRLLSWLTRAAEQYEPQLLIGHCRSEIGEPFEAVRPVIKGFAGVSRPMSLGPGALTGNTVTNAGGIMTALSAGAEPSAGSEPVRSSSTPDEASRSDSRGAARLPDSHLRQQLHHFGALLLQAAERGPVLVVIEDVQWADVETLELLKLWARSIYAQRADGHQLAVALVLTHRPVAEDGPLAQLVGELGGEGRARTVAVESLGADATSALAAELLMSPIDAAVRGACATLFGDRPVTPLYINQILRLLISRGYLTAPGQAWSGQWDFSRLDQAVQHIPATATDAIDERAARLAVETKALLSAAAVLGRRFSLAAVSKTAGDDDDLARECLEEAERAGFVSDDDRPEADASDEGFVFTHDNFREALYRSLAADQRRHLHVRAGEALLALSRRKGRDVAAELAHHFHHGGEHDRAFRFAFLAGELALKGNQYSAASELFAQALEHGEAAGRRISWRLLERLGHAASLALHVARAEGAYRRLLARATRRTERMRVFMRIAELHDRGHNWQAAVEYYDRAVTLGLPWHLRNRAMQTLFAVVALALGAFLPSSVILVVCAFMKGRAGRSRREIVHQSARQASARCVTYGRLFAGLRYGSFAVVAGLGERGPTRGAPFGIATAFMQVYMAILGWDRKAEQWAARGTEAEAQAWPAAERLFYHLLRGTAGLFLADEDDALPELETCFALAMESKDPMLLEICAMPCISACRLFGWDNHALAVIGPARQFARAEGLRGFESLLLVQQACAYIESSLVTQAAEAIEALKAYPGGLNTDEELAVQMFWYYDLIIEYHFQGPSAVLAELVLDRLAQCERKPVFVPVVSIPALFFKLASDICAQLDSVPAELMTRLRRARKRPRWGQVGGRWRKPWWLMAYAVYDDMAGRPTKSLRELDRALDLLRRYRVHGYHLALCGMGEVAFSEGSVAQRRCRESLDELVADRPDLREIVERRRRWTPPGAREPGPSAGGT